MPPISPVFAWLFVYRYPIVFPLAIAEGPIVMLLSGLLVRIGFFEFWPIYLLLIAGDLTGDIVWYLVGRHGARSLIDKYGHFFNLDEKSIEFAEDFFHKNQTRILFISKLTMGFGFAIATLVAAGAARVPFKKYLIINILGGFVWTGILMAVGYFFGNFYLFLNKGIRWMFIVAMIILAGFAAYGFSRAMKKNFSKV
jgi:membrane protein DedA with SNARE-associated domain